jgi:predicted PurR-regulated permease PerM
MRSDITLWAIRGMGLTVGILIVLGLVALGVTAASVLLTLFIAVLLASALEPIVGAGRERLRLGRGWTILAVYLVFMVGVIAFAFIVIPAAVDQAEEIIASLPPFFEETRARAAELRPAALSRSVTALIDSVAGILKPPPPPDPDTVVEVGAAVAEATAWLATLLTIVFFWLVEHARLQRYVLAFIPAERRAGSRNAWNEIESRLGLWVRGQLILMGAIGGATAIAYTLLGLPGALLLALIAALTEAIPIVGPLLGAIPAVLVAATVSPELALVVAGVYLVLQLVEGSVLVPMVMRNTVGISPLLVFISLLIGGAVGGILGAFLAVPVAASIEIILSRLQARETRVAQDPASITTPDEGTADEMGRSLPDAAGAPGSGPSPSEVN